MAKDTDEKPPGEGGDGGKKAKKNPSDKKGKKGKNDKPGKKGKAGAPDAEASGIRLSVSQHPRARAQVRRAKGLGGLAGFILTAMLSLRASVPAVDAGERALIAGLVGYLLGWACGVTVWRQLMVAEIKLAAEQVRERRAKTAAGDS